MVYRASLVVEVCSNPLQLQITGGTRMAYEVPPLPYDYAALEPHIDEATMKVHHDKHHQAYVDKATGPPNEFGAYTGVVGALYAWRWAPSCE